MVSYVEILYVPDPPEGDAAEPAHEELLAWGRAGVASLKVLLDLAMGPRLLAIPLTEEAGEIFPDWQWNRRLHTGLFGAESQARLRHVQAQEAVDLLTADRTAPAPRPRTAPSPHARLPVVLARRLTPIPPPASSPGGWS